MDEEQSMSQIGHFLGGIATLVWQPDTKQYLLLHRADDKDVGAGHWECVTGRVDQGESFGVAFFREVHEEIQPDTKHIALKISIHCLQ
ncbi:MAG: NUDIX domain-containing protein [Chloroflexi bacterium]|nr:NUDIX domain-containing protein [Chloroflexota bacterium]